MTRNEYLKRLVYTRKNRNKRKEQQTSSPEKYPQGFFKCKKCKNCKNLFTPKAPSELYCSDNCKDYGLTEAYYKRVYKITIQEYLDMAEAQNFLCQICKKENFAMRESHSGCLVVDHEHKTNKVRGLLCHNCNRAIGLLQDNTDYLKNAITYLESVTTIPKGSTIK